MSFMRTTTITAIIHLVLFTTVAARAEVLWRGDFETGDTSQWTKTQRVAPNRLAIVSSPVRQGQHAARFEVRQGDDPINASGDRSELVYAPLEAEGNERWYGWSTLWPSTYPSANTWQVFTQWHHTGLTGSPPLEMYVIGEAVHLRIDARTVLWTTPLVRGRWHDFVLHVKWSSDPDVGFVELWYDGARVLPKTFGRNMYPGQKNYLKQGLYRSDTIAVTGTLFHDGMTIGTSFDDLDVTPPALTNEEPVAPAVPPAVSPAPEPPPSPEAPAADESGPHVADAVAPDAGCGLARRSSSPPDVAAATILLGIAALLRRSRTGSPARGSPSSDRSPSRASRRRGRSACGENARATAAGEDEPG